MSFTIGILRVPITHEIAFHVPTLAGVKAWMKRPDFPMEEGDLVLIHEEGDPHVWAYGFRGTRKPIKIIHDYLGKIPDKYPDKALVGTYAWNTAYAEMTFGEFSEVVRKSFKAEFYACVIISRILCSLMDSTMREENRAAYDMMMAVSFNHIHIEWPEVQSGDHPLLNAYRLMAEYLYQRHEAWIQSKKKKPDPENLYFKPFEQIFLFIQKKENLDLADANLRMMHYVRQAMPIPDFIQIF